MLAVRSILLAGLTALCVSAAPASHSTNPAPETLSVSFYSDSQCSVTTATPPGLKANKCYPITGEIGSFRYYAPAFEGGSVAVYAGDDCEGEAVQSFSTFYLGCAKGNGKGKSVMYTHN